MKRSTAFAVGLLAASAIAAVSHAATPQSLFNDNCSACHQTTGKGVKGAFPALAGEHLSYLGGWQAGAIESAWQQIGRIHARVLKA